MIQRGFTLLELLLGLLVSGILAHLAVPAFKSLLESQQRQTTAQSLAQGLRFARSEAIAHNRAVVIHALDDDWGQGWRVIVDVSGRGHEDEDNPVRLLRQESGRVAIIGNGPVKNQVRFSGLGEPVFPGGGFRAGTVHVCATDQAQSLHQIVLAPSGRISLRSDRAEQALCRSGSGTLVLKAASEPAVPWAWRT
ncbi:prepilin-type N-terminal cleavage/methylation domain-containing protein [Pseudomonas kairouanensis]|uniref:Type II secretion system protein H n=1 Tax=Pseudomonas kairouanensis TaxID=2293832 RepID=A0A4Z0B131_9PSED|nr:GspH/FimT family protein [Pseudomonas kairouanensis]TFY92400.1 prepilin-type N-terminal cleavage/methylation domain-containing protein [Pseudomonas kairouanensis]